MQPNEKAYKAPAVGGRTYVYQVGGMQALVIAFNDGSIHFATRKFTGDTWSPPIPPEYEGKF